MPIVVEDKACAPGPLVEDSPQHGQPLKVVESIAGVSKEETFEDIPPWKDPLTTISPRCSGIPVPRL